MRRAPLQDSRTPRQKEFISVAARLFADRGYHRVGINEISAELGLSGPAIYRHYPSKEALLVAVLEDAIAAHLEEIRDIVSSLADPRETLTAIIQNHIDFVFDQSENIVTWRTEFRTLPEADRHRLRYLMRLYTEEWVRTVRPLRPDLDDDQVRAVCDAVIALLQSPTEYHSYLSRAELSRLLTAMATQALLFAAAAGTPRPGVGGRLANGARARARDGVKTKATVSRASAKAAQPPKAAKVARA